MVGDVEGADYRHVSKTAFWLSQCLSALSTAIGERKYSAIMAKTVIYPNPTSRLTASPEMAMVSAWDMQAEKGGSGRTSCP